MLLILFLLFTAVPVLEIYLLLQLSDEWGGLNTISLVIITGVVGAYLAKSQGRQVINQIQRQMSAGEVPADSLVHGLIIFAGGLFLVTPGILTDIVGFCFVIPGTRNLVVLFVKHWLGKKISTGQVQFYSSNGVARDVTPREIKDVSPKQPENN